MFERFTKQAQRVVVDAQDSARRLGHDETRSKHLLLALTGGEDAASEILNAAGVTRELLESSMTTAGLGEADAAALSVVGIDLDEVKRAVEATFGENALSRARRPRKGHIRFTKGAKEALTLSLKEAIRLGHKHIGSEHILLGLLRDHSGSARTWLIDHGHDPVAIAESLVERIKRAS